MYNVTIYFCPINYKAHSSRTLIKANACQISVKFLYQARFANEELKPFSADNYASPIMPK